ncbi:MAG: NAD-dependent epimerase/dehydratase family protein [Candidatus Paceibacterota bacterium]|jgi:nucleoside-diphosphate-sugar epimerase
MRNKMMSEINIIEQDWKEVILNVGSKRLKNFSKKTILITGANGFIGRSLVYFFIYLNENFSTNIKLILIAKEAKFDSKISNLIKNKKLKFIKHDILKKTSINEKIDYVFHLAAVISPKFNSTNPVEALKINVIGTENILDALKNIKITKFLYFSSAGVYGNPDKKNIPTKEEFNGNVSPVSFRSCYAEGKRAGEACTMAYFRQYNLPINIVRPAHMYGPLMRLNEDVTINYFLNCGLAKKDIVLQTKGQDTRSFCYITDVLSIVLLVSLMAKSGEIFNISNEKAEVKIIDLAELICKIFDNKIKVKIQEKSKTNFFKSPMTRNVPSMEKVKNVLKFTPKITLNDGLVRIINNLKLNK